MRCPSSELLKALYFSLFNNSYHTGICFMHILYICFSLSTELFPPWDLGPHINCVLVITLIFVSCSRKMFSKYLSNQYIYYDNNDAYDSNSLFYSSVLRCLCCILLGIWRIYIYIYIYFFPSLDYILTLFHFQVYKYEKDILELYVVKRRKQEANQAIPFTFHLG